MVVIRIVQQWAAVIAVAMIWGASQGIAAADAASGSGTDPILGVWLTEGGDSKVEIVRRVGSYMGTIVWLREPQRDGLPALDRQNVNLALRGRSIMGIEILTGFVRGQDGRWRGGEIYSPRQGRSYPAEMALIAGDRLEITVRAGILTKQVVWTR